MTRARVAASLASFAVACTIASATAAAQAPKGADKLSPAAVAESLAVLATLDLVVASNPNDAAAWHHRGMVAWALRARDEADPPVAGLDRTRLGRMADSSLRLAAAIDKTSAYYRLMAGRYLLTTESGPSRAASYDLFDAAVSVARHGGDPWIHSETAVEAGRVYWRRYDALANRWMRIQPGDACEPMTAMVGPAEVARIIDEARQCAMPLDFEGSGESDYRRAEELFREAFDAQPSNQRAYRQLAMLLVERNRWTELGALTKARLGSAPWDAWAWLTMGLVMYERKDGAAQMVAAFDSAFSLLPPSERKWFSRFERVLKPQDTVKVLAADDATRFAVHRMFWLDAIPLWSRDASQPQLDYLSRLVYAELRWTVEELNVRGAETDRGDVYIRYGAPDIVMTRRTGEDNAIATTWLYKIGLVISFTGQATFATARIAPSDQAAFGDIVQTAPVRWLVAPDFAVDSMPSQLARFRARADSVDVVVATLPPVTAMLTGSTVRTSVRSDFWVLAGGTVMVARDSVLPTAPGVQVFTHRLKEHAYLYRAEASMDGSMRGARTSASFVAGTDSATGFRMRGFGISDLLLATSVSEPRDRALRWNDLIIAPLAGATDRTTTLSLVWENYEFTSDNGAARYTVTITLERERSAVGRISAEIVSKLSSAVGVERTNDRIKLQFERTLPHAAIVLDHLDLSLGTTTPGDYQLTLQVTERGTGRTTSRTVPLVVREK